MIDRLDHVTIRTNDLADMASFYRRVLNLEAGRRPDFSIDGAWLFCGDDAILNLAATGDEFCGTGVQIEHFAVKAEDFEATSNETTAIAAPARNTMPTGSTGPLHQ